MTGTGFETGKLMSDYYVGCERLITNQMLYQLSYASAQARFPFSQEGLK